MRTRYLIGAERHRTGRARNQIAVELYYPSVFRDPSDQIGIVIGPSHCHGPMSLSRGHERHSPGRDQQMLLGLDTQGAVT